MEDSIAGAPVPLYYKLKKTILSMIENGELQADEIIPSERVLQETYNMSRTTVRKAIDELVNEGFLYKRHGKGTFVKGRRFAQELINLTTNTESLKALGFDPKSRVIESGIIEPKKVIAENLGLASGEKVFHTQRVFYGDDEPVNYTFSYIPYKHVTDIEKHDFAVDSIYDAIKNEYGIKILRVERTIEAVRSAEQIALSLETDKTSPLLKVTGWVFAGSGKDNFIVEYFVTYYRSDKSKFFISLEY